MPFEYKNLQQSTALKVNARILRKRSMSGFELEAAFDGVIDFLCHDPKGQLFSQLISIYVRGKLGAVEPKVKAGLPQIILVGIDSGETGDLKEIKGIFGITGLNDADFKVNSYLPGSPDISRDATEYFKEYLGLYAGRQTEIAGLAGAKGADNG